MMLRFGLTVLMLAALIVLQDVARAQVTTVINVPPSPSPGGIGSNTQLNLYDGGYIPYGYGSYNAFLVGALYGNTNTEMNVYGGTVSTALDVAGHSVLNLYGGVTSGLNASYGSVVNIYGGSLPNYLKAEFGSKINVSGGDFLLDGMPISELQTIGNSTQIDLPSGSVLNGTLADGTPFYFDGSGRFASGTLNLQTVALPVIGAMDLRTSTDPLPPGLRSGQTLTVDSDAASNHNFLAAPDSIVNLASGNLTVAGGNGTLIALGATFNVTGGAHETNLRSLNSGVINMTDGVVRTITAGPNGVVNMTGGTTEFGGVYADGGIANIANVAINGGVNAVNSGTVNYSNSSAWYDSTVATGGTLNVSTGALGELRINDGHVNLSGGSVYHISCRNGSDLQISGHTIIDEIEAYNGSKITLIGDEFFINGQPISGLNTVGDMVDVQVPDGSVISGTYQDGVPFALTPDSENSIVAATVRLRRAETPAIGPATIDTATDVVPGGIRHGQTLTVGPGGAIPDYFEAGAGSTVNVLPGGVAGDHINVMGGTMNVSGGQLGYDLKPGAGGHINISGDARIAGMIIANAGTVHQAAGTVTWLTVANGGTFTSSGGVVEKQMYVYGGNANLHGGTVKGALTVESNGIATADGATLEFVVDVYDGSTFNFAGGNATGNVDVYGGGTVNVSGGVMKGDMFAYGVVNITGGNPAGELFARSGSVVNISGGLTGGMPWTVALDAESGSAVRVSGGVQADRFKTRTGSTLTLVGGNFKLNGQPVNGLSNVGNTVNVNMGTQSTLTGVYADGTPFAFTTDASSIDYDVLANGTLRLEAAAVAAAGPAQIDAATDSVPSGIRQGQTLTVGPGAAVGHHFMAGEGSTVQVHAGGAIGDDFEAVGSTVNIDGGSIGEKFDAFDGSVVNISGGSIDKKFQAHAGSVINITGGRVGTSDPENTSQALAGSVVNISGGELRNFHVGNDVIVNMTGGLAGDYFGASEGSTVRISGGTVGDHLYAATGGQLTIAGNDFRINGQPVTGLNNVGDKVPVTMDLQVVTGVLADGTPIAFSHWDADYINPNTLTLEAAIVPAVTPRHWLASVDPLPHGIRQGEVLTIDDGGSSGDDFNAGRGSVVDLQPGGRIGYNFEAIGATININGGDVDRLFTAFEGSVVNVRGGVLNEGIGAVGNSVINVYAGSQPRSAYASLNSVINLFGGSFRSGVGVGDSVGNTATLNVYGGSFGASLLAHNGSRTNLFGTDFAINGVPMGQLTAGQPFTILERNVTLSGLLTTGEAFSIFLNSVYDYRAAVNLFDGSRITVTSVAAGDFNRDGIVDSADYVVWRKHAGSANPNLAADGNFDGFVDQTDYQVWRSHLGRVYAPGSATALSQVVPEPTIGLSALTGTLMLGRYRTARLPQRHASR